MTYSLRITEFTASRASDRAALEQFVRAGQHVLRNSPHCAGCQTYLDGDDPTKVVSMEVWTDQRGREDAARDIPAEAVRGAMALMDRAPRSRNLSGPLPTPFAIRGGDASPIRLALIIASVREERFGPIIANWFAAIIARDERFAVETIDLATVDLPTALPANPADLAVPDRRPPQLRGTSAALSNAEAFVVVTPEYNHGMPASLKHFIDWHFVEWHRKPVAAIGYGGLGGGMRAIENLRLVMAELHATVIRDTVTFNAPWELFSAAGDLLAPDRAVHASEALRDSLAWWAGALRRGRSAGEVLSHAAE